MPNIFAISLITVLAATASAQQESEGFTRFAGFELGHVTLGDVQRVLGPSRLNEAGDAGEYEAWVCYSLPKGQVEFDSGEIGGEAHDLLGVTVSLDGRNKTCPSWPKTIRIPALQIGGVRLGILARTFAASFKVPVQWRGNIASGNYQYQREPSHTEILALPEEIRTKAEKSPASFMLDVDVTVEGTFERGRLVKLTTWKIETY
jgi:hypothetical protein